MDFIPIRSYDNYIAAQMMMQRLEEENIRVFLQDENTVTVSPILSNAVGGIKLMVHKGQLESALQLISKLEESYHKAATCPQCGSDKVLYVSQPNNPLNWFSALFFWLLGSYAMSVKNVYHCYNCGFEFEKLPENDLPTEQ